MQIKHQQEKLNGNFHHQTAFGTTKTNMNGFLYYKVRLGCRLKRNPKN